MARVSIRAKRTRFSRLPPNLSVRWFIRVEHRQPFRRSPWIWITSTPAFWARTAQAHILSMMDISISSLTSSVKNIMS